MRHFFQVVFLALVSICIQGSLSRRVILQLNNSSGTISSPGFPLNYSDNAVQRVFIEAEPGHVITLHFLTFDMEDLDENGTRTDFIRIVDGRTNPFRLFLYGNLTTPFYLTSKTNRIRIRFTSNGNGITYKGFTFNYQVHAVPSSCNETADEDEDNEVDETESDYFESCDDMENVDPTQCVRGCAANLSLAETNLKSCVKPGETFVPQTCIEPHVLEQCEDSNYIDCPYSSEEIIQIYDTLQLDIDSSLSDEERESELSSLESIYINVGRVVDGPCTDFCRRHPTKPQYKPKYCGNYKNKRFRKACIECRLNGCGGTII